MTTLTFDGTLEHYGVKGMKWGKRKASETRESADGVKVTLTPGRKVDVKGGNSVKPSEDAIVAAVGRQKIKKNSTDALSNAELKVVVDRMNLEAQFKRLSKDRRNMGEKFVADIVEDMGKQVMEDAAGSLLGEAYRKKN